MSRRFLILCKWTFVIFWMAKRHHRKLKAADKTQIHWVGKLKTEFLEPT